VKSGIQGQRVMVHPDNTLWYVRLDQKQPQSTTPIAPFSLRKTTERRPWGKTDGFSKFDDYLLPRKA
jgi:hypothetical protein